MVFLYIGISIGWCIRYPLLCNKPPPNLATAVAHDSARCFFWSGLGLADLSWLTHATCSQWPCKASLMLHGWLAISWGDSGWLCHVFLSRLDEPVLMVLVPRAVGKAEAANILRAEDWCPVLCHLFHFLLVQADQRPAQIQGRKERLLGDLQNILLWATLIALWSSYKMVDHFTI